jgi:hypothetical protein
MSLDRVILTPFLFTKKSAAAAQIIIKFRAHDNIDAQLSTVPDNAI